MKRFLCVIFSLVFLAHEICAAETHSRNKRQIMPLGLAYGGLGAIGPAGVAGLGLGGLGIGPLAAAAVLPPNFGRPVPGGPHAGAFGGLAGSPTFGPGLVGPFNHPVERESRLNQLVNHVRRSQNRALLPDTAGATLDYAYLPYAYPGYYYY